MLYRVISDNLGSNDVLVFEKLMVNGLTGYEKLMEFEDLNHELLFK
jgi:hypothetical protein